jgi:hypothetical protein
MKGKQQKDWWIKSCKTMVRDGTAAGPDRITNVSMLP